MTPAPASCKSITSADSWHSAHGCKETRGASRTFFLYENLSSATREFSRKCGTLKCENSTLASGYRLSSVTILWAELTKRSKEIFCSRNLVVPRDFYDARRTFYASSHEILVEKKVRRAPDNGSQCYVTLANNRDK